MRSVFRLSALLFVAVCFIWPSGTLAQGASVDMGYFPVPSNPLPTNTSFQQLVQPDGKIIVYNAPVMFVGGMLRSGIFRLNADGSADTTFNFTDSGGVAASSVALSPDGKIIMAGGTAPNHAKMGRLNSDGSLDNAFSVFQSAAGSPELTGAYFTINSVQADGKVIATYTSWGNIMGTWYSYTMRRYNVDGSVDTSFTSPALEGGHLVSTSSVIENLPDGSFYLAISSGNHLGRAFNVSRRLSNGTVDPTYSQYNQSISGGFFIAIYDLSRASDGGVYVTGYLWPSMQPGPGVVSLIKFLPTGANDASFTSPTVVSGSQVRALSGGKVFYTATGGTITRPLVRLNGDGTVDNTYVLDPAITSIKNRWSLDLMGRPIFLAETSGGVRLVRLLDNGSIDPTFSPALGAAGTTSLVVTQPDGKSLIVGAFTGLNGSSRAGFARVNSDGSLDASFDPGTGFNVAPRRLIVQPDNKIIAVGSFSTYNSASVSRIVRLLPNGSIDTSFSAAITGSSVDAIDLQPDGKVVIGGGFTAVNGTSRTGIARLETNGALDTTFNTILGGNAYVATAIVEPNGKIAIIGNFSGVNGFNRNSFARLEASGATDMTFNAPTDLPSMGGLKRQDDGKYITYPNGPTMERWNSDGTRDTAFTSPSFMINGSSGWINDVLIRPDGSYIVAGQFNQIGGTLRSYITRLKRNGSHDLSFLTTGTNGQVSSLSNGGSGKVLVSGNFTTIENVSRLGIARLDVPAVVTKTPFDYDGDGRADVSVFRASENQWYILRSTDFGVTQSIFAIPDDVPVPADFDGDGRTDIAIYRPSSGDWWSLSTINNQQINFRRGGQQAGDIPLPSDFDGDGRSDYVVFRPSTNQWLRSSSVGATPSDRIFGLAGDKPVIGDFDGDGRSDVAVYRPSDGNWWWWSSFDNVQRATRWGISTDIPAPADYDGDGKTDFAVYRPSTGVWYILNSSNGSPLIGPFGLSEDKPVPADYDGDGKADIAVFRPSTGIWYLLRTTSGFTGLQFGISTDLPTQNVFLR